MTAADRLTIILSALSLLFLMSCAGLGLIVRITGRWTRVEVTLKAMVDQLRTIVHDNGEEHKDIRHSVERIDDRLNRHEEWHRGKDPSP